MKSLGAVGAVIWCRLTYWAQLPPNLGCQQNAHYCFFDMTLNEGITPH